MMPLLYNLLLLVPLLLPLLLPLLPLLLLTWDILSDQRRFERVSAEVKNSFIRSRKSLLQVMPGTGLRISLNSCLSYFGDIFIVQNNGN